MSQLAPDHRVGSLIRVALVRRSERAERWVFERHRASSLREVFGPEAV
jgi:hypothetical protein